MNWITIEITLPSGDFARLEVQANDYIRIDVDEDLQNSQIWGVGNTLCQK